MNNNYLLQKHSTALAPIPFITWPHICIILYTARDTASELRAVCVLSVYL